MFTIEKFKGYKTEIGIALGVIVLSVLGALGLDYSTPSISLTQISVDGVKVLDANGNHMVTKDGCGLYKEIRTIRTYQYEYWLFDTRHATYIPIIKPAKASGQLIITNSNRDTTEYPSDLEKRLNSIQKSNTLIPATYDINLPDSVKYTHRITVTPDQILVLCDYNK